MNLCFPLAQQRAFHWLNSIIVIVFSGSIISRRTKHAHEHHGHFRTRIKRDRWRINISQCTRDAYTYWQNKYDDDNGECMSSGLSWLQKQKPKQRQRGLQSLNQNTMLKSRQSCSRSLLHLENALRLKWLQVKILHQTLRKGRRQRQTKCKCCSRLGWKHFQEVWGTSWRSHFISYHGWSWQRNRVGDSFSTQLSDLSDSCWRTSNQAVSNQEEKTSAQWDPHHRDEEPLWHGYDLCQVV